MAAKSPPDKPASCVLCPRPPAFVGVWVPKDQRCVKAPVVYALCARCQRKPNALKRVEQQILGELHGTIN